MSATVDATMQFFVVFYTTIIFTVLALVELEQTAKSVILLYIAGGLWIVTAIAHFIVGDASSILTYGGAYLFLGFAFIFFISAFYNSFGLIKTRHRQKNPTGF